MAMANQRATTHSSRTIFLRAALLTSASAPVTGVARPAKALEYVNGVYPITPPPPPQQVERFSAGFTTDPIANTSPSYIGLNYNLSGVGWAPGSGLTISAELSDRAANTWLSSPGYTSPSYTCGGATVPAYNLIPEFNTVIKSTGYVLLWTIYDNPANTAPSWTGGAGTGKGTKNIAHIAWRGNEPPSSLYHNPFAKPHTIHIQSSRNARGYRVVILIPWKDFPPTFKPRTGNFLGFGMSVRDMSAHYRQLRCVIWAGDNNDYRYTTGLGVLVLK